MSEMIERVARATYFAGECLGIKSAFDPKNDAHWAHWWQEDRELHEAIARAAIEAMRLATVDMAIVGFKAYEDSLLKGAEGIEPFQEAWTAMADAALALAAPPVEQAKTEVEG